jgi:hypothetical protein
MNSPNSNSYKSTHLSPNSPLNSISLANLRSLQDSELLLKESPILIPKFDNHPSTPIRLSFETIKNVISSTISNEISNLFKGNDEIILISCILKAIGIPAEAIEFEKKQKKNKLFDDIDDDNDNNINKFVLINDDFALLLTPFLHGKQNDTLDESKLATKLAEAIKESNESLSITHTIDQEVNDACEDFDRVNLYLNKMEKQVELLFRTTPIVPIQIGRIVKATMERLATFKQTITEINDYLHQNITLFVERKRLLEYFGTNSKITRILENATITFNTVMIAYNQVEERMLETLSLFKKIEAVGHNLSGIYHYHHCINIIKLLYIIVLSS